MVDEDVDEYKDFLNWVVFWGIIDVFFVGDKFISIRLIFFLGFLI